MLSTHLRRGVRATCRQRPFCTGNQPPNALQDFTMLVKTHKGALLTVGGLISITILGAFFAGYHLRSNFEKQEQSLSRDMSSLGERFSRDMSRLGERMSRDMSNLEERMSRDMERIDNNMQEIRNYIFELPPRKPYNAADVSEKK